MDNQRSSQRRRPVAAETKGRPRRDADRYHAMGRSKVRVLLMIARIRERILRR